MTDQIDGRHGRRLLQLARDAIGRRLGVPGEGAGNGLDEAELKRPLASFVTLKLDGRLRGCIGNLEPTEPLVDGIERNAVQAAFHDHRFAPLTREEFDRVEIDISILTEARPLDYSDAEDLLSRLRPGVDGVILRQGRARATFLPQVWEQLADPVAFLEHLCAKAGLPRSAWRDSHPEIFVYQVQSFTEGTDETDS